MLAYVNMVDKRYANSFFYNFYIYTRLNECFPYPAYLNKTHTNAHTTVSSCSSFSMMLSSMYVCIRMHTVLDTAEKYECCCGCCGL